MGDLLTFKMQGNTCIYICLLFSSLVYRVSKSEVLSTFDDEFNFPEHQADEAQAELEILKKYVNSGLEGNMEFENQDSLKNGLPTWVSNLRKKPKTSFKRKESWKYDDVFSGRELSRLKDKYDQLESQIVREKAELEVLIKSIEDNLNDKENTRMLIDECCELMEKIEIVEQEEKAVEQEEEAVGKVAKELQLSLEMAVFNRKEIEKHGR